MFRFLSLGIFFIFLFSSCQSTKSVNDTMSATQIMQIAQGEFNRGREEIAIEYYHFLKDNFGDNPRVLVAAEYEIAYIIDRQGKYGEAQKHFNTLLARYEEEDHSYPLWVRVLSEKMLLKIEENQ